MKQGEIWYAYLDPAEGREQAGRKPIVILSGNLLNRYLGIVICLPITYKIKNYKGNLILTPNKINGLKKKLEVLTFHISSISKSRLKSRIGSISEEETSSLLSFLNEILTY